MILASNIHVPKLVSIFIHLRIREYAGNLLGIECEELPLDSLVES
jgi:hypothetical protein